MKLTKSAVENLITPDVGQAFYRDELLPGFGVRVTAGGIRSFIVEKRVLGKVRRKTLGRFGPLTVEQARKEAQKFLGKVAAGIDPIAERRDQGAQVVTLGQVFETYLKLRTGLRASTVHDYGRILREAFGDWQDQPIQNITKDKVAKRHQDLGGRSPARANNAMRLLRALFNFASGQYEDSKGRSLFPESPVKRLSHTRAWYRVERRRTVIKQSELPAWYEAVLSIKTEGDTHARTVADYLLVLLFTGMRRSEGMQLRWENVDLVARIFTVPDTKNREPLVLPLTDYLYDLLLARKGQEGASAYVFPGQGGDGYLIEPRPQMRKITERSGVCFTLHDLRRTYITAAEGLDIPMYAIKRLVNHKMNDVTAGYIISDVERLRAPMQKITDYLLRLMTREYGHVIALASTRSSVG